jgi:ribosomal protein S18 acetylase RimI-like enzyme
MTVSVRPAHKDDAAAIARVQVDTSRLAYRDVLAPSLLSGLTYEGRETVWAELLGRHDQWVLVAEDECIVGFVNAGRNRGPDAQYTSEIYALYVLPESQGKGVGTSLLGAAAARLIREGHRSVCLETLRNSRARPFYDRRAGVVVGETSATRDGHTVDKVTYGWLDLTALCARLLADGKRHTPRSPGAG